MTLKGEGLSTVIAMWVLTGLTIIFVVLRIYTRVVVTHSFGVDDIVFSLAFLLLLMFTICITVSAQYGFGQNMNEILNPDNIVRAILWELVGQTCNVIGMSLAKWSLGFFLLRLVTKTWLKVIIWINMGCLMSASISTTFVCWLQCSPHNYLWDRRIEGSCHLDAVSASTVLNSFTIVVDIVFAVLPWLFIWELQIKRQERIVILTTMSLGIAAAACGIKRAASNGGLTNPNYLKATVPLILWSAIEFAVTMICIGIAVCLPLYKDFLKRFISTVSQSHSRIGNMYPYKPGDDSQGGFVPLEYSPNHNRELPKCTDPGNIRPSISQDVNIQYESRGSVKAEEHWQSNSQDPRACYTDPERLIPDGGIHVTQEYKVTRH
ncbi:hypothetical protein B0I35DRAFT_442270 [Stachybotrys elegans]|uniref:Rhodopsin domain-containing protein n=1 Tax=Stachybotrys elegans TaxID=80388 RepID=A0A8K0SHY1_9HYPO|nr:hypothetical protein B0I35DRAFT_442270 [Stachybotrys elegans]